MSTEEMSNVNLGESSLPTPDEVKIDSAAGGAPRSSGGNNTKKIVFGSIAVLIVLGIIIGVSVGVSNSKKETENDKEKRKHTFVEVNDFLDTVVSNPSLLEDDSTPQSRAAYWMTHEDELNLPIPDPFTSEDPDAKQKYIQRFAMATFFYSTNGDEDWLEQLNFLSEKDVCGWYKIFSLKNSETQEDTNYQIGVECNEVTGLVQSILIPGNRLSGILPPELGLLTSLQSIALYNNDIGGELPYEMQNLSDLDYLAVHRNQLQGTLPDWLPNIPYLRVLGLGNNNFVSSIPESFSTMTRLAELSLDDNQLTGGIEVFNELTNLKHLYLEDNEFEGEFDENTFAKLDALETLDISDNNFTGIIPKHLFYLYNLRVLDMHDNFLSGNLPTFDGVNGVLKFVALHDNLLEGSIPDSIYNLESLAHLDLSLNDFTGNITDSLGDLEELQYLFLSDNDFDEGEIPDFLEYDDLVELSLKSTNRRGAIPDWLADLDDTLLFLDLSENELVGTIPERFGELTGLAFLLLHENFLTGQIPDSIKEMRTLGMLTINQNEIEDDMEGLLCKGDEIIVGQIQVLTSDCSGSDPLVKCECCTECCSHDPEAGEEGGDSEHEHDVHDECDITDILPANLDPYWESLYQRNVYFFDDDLQFFLQRISTDNNND